MSALLESIALSYAKSKGLSYITDEAREYAAKKLGVDTKNPKYAISIGNMKIDPMKMISNQLFKSAISGGKMSMGLPLIAAGLGLSYMRNPLREGSINYNPELQGQINYLSGMDNNMIGKDPNSGLLKYGPDSVLRNKNVVSMFGTNDYAKSLQKYIDKMEARKTKGFNTIGIGPFKTKTTGFTDFQQSQLDKAKRELEDLTTDEFDKVDEFMEKITPAAPVYTPSPGDNGGGGSGGTNNTQHGSSGMTKSQHSAFRMARGGIASL